MSRERIPDLTSSVTDSLASLFGMSHRSITKQGDFDFARRGLDYACPVILIASGDEARGLRRAKT